MLAATAVEHSRVFWQCHFDIGLFVTNATNKTYAITNTGVFNSIGVAANMYGEPRMYGMQLGYPLAGSGTSAPLGLETA